MKIRVAIVGATGRMGTLIAGLIESGQIDGPSGEYTSGLEFELVARLHSGSDLSELVGADVVVDVTAPEVSPGVVEFAVRHGIRVLVGTSGWSAERIATLRKAIDGQAEAGVLIVPNFSLGSVLATRFAGMAARFYDSVEIIESHHLDKRDSPSGTAIRTAELIATARSERGPVRAPHSAQRARGQQVSSVPIHSLRLSGVVAKQDVVFGGAGELLTISHETLANTAYEAGIRLALRAAAANRGIAVGLDALLDLTGDHPQVRR
ncbi:MAG: 4-hydroxy-tetrahydrodipicolinate reductase [Terrimesophilobacter sp.]